MHEVLNAIFYVLWTGCQWTALPKNLPPRSTVWDYLDLWDWDGTLERIHHALYVEVREHAGREARVIGSWPVTLSSLLDGKPSRRSPFARPSETDWSRRATEDAGNAWKPLVALKAQRRTKVRSLDAFGIVG